VFLEFNGSLTAGKRLSPYASCAFRDRALTSLRVHNKENKPDEYPKGILVPAPTGLSARAYDVHIAGTNLGTDMRVGLKWLQKVGLCTVLKGATKRCQLVDWTMTKGSYIRRRGPDGTP
jgi:hypothetical protein